jgi:membrane protein implicated in regulation of membrane protease activity
MIGMIHVLAGDANSEAARWLRDFVTSWPVQAIVLALYVGLAVLAFTRVARDWDDGPRKQYFRAAIVALGVFFVLEFVLGKALLAVVMWPTWLYLFEVIWLFGMWLYYFIRFITRQRSGPGDDETRRRGAALEGVIAPLSDEARHTTGG